MPEPAQLNGGNGADEAASSGDTVLAFTIPERDARGRIVRMGPILTAILAAHDYPPALCRLLGEALTLTALLGTTVQKNGGETTLQAQARGGPVDLLVCDYRAGAVRGYVRFDPEYRPAAGALLPDLFGTGVLAITVDQTGAERYQGIVPLEGRSLSEAVERYFTSSEQVPTLVRAAVVPSPDGGWSGGGLLIQHLPHGEVDRPRLSERAAADDWRHVAALAATVTPAELGDPGLDLDALLWRLFNEDEVRVAPPFGLSRGCRCSPQRIREVLARFPAEELDEMRDAAGRIIVNCEFCARSFPVDL